VAAQRDHVKVEWLAALRGEQANDGLAVPRGQFAQRGEVIGQQDHELHAVAGAESRGQPLRRPVGVGQSTIAEDEHRNAEVFHDGASHRGCQTILGAPGRLAVHGYCAEAAFPRKKLMNRGANAAGFGWNAGSRDRHASAAARARARSAASVSPERTYSA
jgi:hypothetical protein